MKSFKKFITEIQNRESPFHGNVRPGSNYPKNLPYIRDPKKEMDLFNIRFKVKGKSKSKVTWYQLKDIKTCFVTKRQEQ